MTAEKNEIQTSLQERQRLAEAEKAYKLLRLRNMLNIVFMLLAIVAMIGIGLGMMQEGTSNWGYVVGIIAVLVKFAEAMLRMPASLNQPRKSRFDRSRRRS